MPGGRPSKIDDVIRQRRTPAGDTVDVTVADAIVEALAIGDYFEMACAAAGISRGTAYGWMRTGADLERRQHRARTAGQTPPRGTRHERRCVEFSRAVEEATARWHQGMLGTLEQMARGGRTITTTSTKVAVDAQGVEHVVERTTRVEALAPSVQAIEWRLARRFPHLYGQRVEVTGAGGGPIEVEVDERDRAAELAESLEAYLAGVRDAAVGPPVGASGPGSDPDGGTPLDDVCGPETALRGE